MISMRIDDQVEQIMREALTAVVKEDPERLQRAFASFSSNDDLAQGTRIALAVSVYVLNEAYGRAPTPAEIQSVATKAATMEKWTDISANEMASLLTAAYAGSRVDEVLTADRIAPVAFVVAANLLSSCCRKDEYWFDYLDRAEAAIEAAPDA